jgi:hypothetical protein
MMGMIEGRVHAICWDVKVLLIRYVGQAERGSAGRAVDYLLINMLVLYPKSYLYGRIKPANGSEAVLP